MAGVSRSQCPTDSSGPLILSRLPSQVRIFRNSPLVDPWHPGVDQLKHCLRRRGVLLACRRVQTIDIATGFLRSASARRSQFLSCGGMRRDRAYDECRQRETRCMDPCLADMIVWYRRNSWVTVFTGVHALLDADCCRWAS